MTGKVGSSLESLLQEMESDPYDWSPMDLGRALDIAGFLEEPMEDAKGWRVTFRYHRKYPSLNVVLYPVQRAHVQVVKHVATVIREAIRRG